MRILHISSRYWPVIGGGENYIKEVSERLVADGHTVVVATTDAGDGDLFWNPAARRLTERFETHQGVQIRRFPVRHLPFSPTSYSIWRYILFWGLTRVPGVPLPTLVWLSRFTPWVPELQRWLEQTEERFDGVGGLTILHESLVAMGLQAARRWQAPYWLYPLTHLGARPMPGQDSVSRYYTMRHQRALVRAATAVVAMTPSEKAYYERQGLPSERIHVVGAGINLETVQGGDGWRFREQHQLRGPLVACVSAMAYDKGTVHLVEAVRRLWRVGQPVALVLAGAITRPFQGYLEQLSAAERQRLCILGPISDVEKRDLLAAADIVAMPSRTDSFGIIYLEAWACGKPVIGARAWGMGDVINDGVDGRLVPFGDVPALAQTLAELLAQPELRACLGQCGAQKVYQDYTWDKRYALLRDFHRQLMPGG